MSRKVRCGRLNGVVTHFGLLGQIDLLGWAYSFTLGAQLRLLTIILTRTVVSYR